MLIFLKKFLICGVLAIFFNAQAQQRLFDTLPDMGSTGGGRLSLLQEQQWGDYYLRQLQGHAPMIRDPLLNDYVNRLGKRFSSHLSQVKTGFHFYLLQNHQVNAFAFFGGNIVLNSGLLLFADDESQLASVMAHELSHISQRHLIRSLEMQKANTPLALAGALGSILLSMADPQIGMAALAGTLAGTQQSLLTFTQSNEQEADRVGLQLLAQSGFDPQSMPIFLQKLADHSRFSSKPPEILLTHPLTANRLADARTRANQWPNVKPPTSPDFYFAKARILVLYSGKSNKSHYPLFQEWEKGDALQKNAAQYGDALGFVKDNAFVRAKSLVENLLQKDPHNVWYLDLMTDIYLGLHQPKSGVNLLQKAKEVSLNPVLQLNLANALIADKQYLPALQILQKYTRSHPNNIHGWDLLAQAASRQGKTAQALAARAEIEALSGKWDRAINALKQASAEEKSGSLQQAGYDARIEQLKNLQQVFKTYIKKTE